MKKKKLPKAAEPYKFKPGQSGNPKGRPLHPIENALRKMTRTSLRKIIRACCKGNLDSLRKIIRNKNSSALEVGVANSMLKAAAKGDYGTIEHIVQRVTGKIPDVLEVNSNNINRNLNGVLDNTKVRAALAELEEDI